MHRALEVEEILIEIFSDFIPNIFELSSHNSTYIISSWIRQSLLNAALTCTSFTEPALDALWAPMGDLRPLFKILPNFKCSVDDPNMTRIEGPISISSRNRFEIYARRIRHYTFTGQGRIPNSVYLRILEELERSYLLPRLQILVVEEWIPQKTILLHLFCPELRIVLARTYSNGANNALPSYPPLNHYIVEAIADLELLETLFSHANQVKIPVPTSFFQTILCSQKLTSLTMRGAVSHIGYPILTTPVEFPALSYLELSVKPADILQLSMLLDSAKFPRLQNLHIYVAPMTGVEMSSNNWRECFKSVAGASESAETICFHAENLGIGTTPFVGLTPSEIVNLFPKTTSLIEFSASGLTFSSMNQSDIENIAHRWQGLTTLGLGPYIHGPRLPFGTLELVARLLPALTALEISVDLEVIPKPEGIPLSNHKLGFLKMGLCPLKHPKKVACCLDRLFPNLGRLIPAAYKHSDYYTGWSKSIRKVEVFYLKRQKARRNKEVGKKEWFKFL